jgi:TonB-linked SusC/RagA family outer membrane protein
MWSDVMITPLSALLARRAHRRWRTAARVAAPLALAALFAGAGPVNSQQTGTITGTVTTEVGQPVAGAQVTVVGTQRGTLTDGSGRFILTNVAAGARQVRVVSIGYRSETQSVQVGPGETVTVQLTLSVSAIALDEVVVTGTVGGTERRAIGNTVGSIRASDVVAVAPIRDMQSLLNARSPGVVITPGTGMVGSGSQIRIRGSSSISLSNTPLLYVDGVRVNNEQNAGPIVQAFASRVISRINDFNPDDIERVEIIKGPAAATLYGTEAANGVIHIITKRGAQGAAQWNLTVRQGANWFRDAEGRVPTNYWQDPATGQVLSLNFAQTEADRGVPLWRTGHLQNYNLSVGGGTADVQYHLSGQMDREEGADRDNAVRRMGARANINVAASPTLDIAGSAGFTSGRFDLACEAGCGGVTWASYFSTPFHTGTFNPNDPMDEQGVNARRGARSLPPEYYWGFAERFQELDRFTGSVNMTHRPAEWFSHRLTLGMDNTSEDDQTIVPITPIYRQWSPTGRGAKDAERRDMNNQTVDYSATVTVPIQEGLASSTSFGAQYYRRVSRFVGAYGQDFALPGLRVIDAAAEVQGNETYLETVSLGIFGQQQFGWNDRRFLTLGLRADDHSAFGESFDVVYYPKISAAWVISEEPFWNIGAVNDLRFRTAWGRAGEQPGAFDALRTYDAIAGPGDASTVTPLTVGNPDLGPEKGEEFEIGFDAGFLADRAGLEFTYYQQRTRDAILLQPVAPSTGFPGSRFINVGELRNFGFEALLRTEPIARPNFSWTATFSLSRNDSEVVDLGDQDEIIGGFGLTHRVGHPVASWFNQRVVDAEFDANGRVINSSMVCDDGAGGTTACFNEAGTMVAPRIFLGRSEPLNEGAFSSTFTLFERVSIYGLVDFKTGFKKWDHVTRVRCALFNNCRESWQASANSMVDPSVMQSAEFQNDPEYRALIASYHHGDIFGDAYTNSSSFLRFREVSVSYMVPEALAQRFRASRASVNLAARNLGTRTNWTGMDPEARFLGGARGLFGGLEQNHLPQITSFITSINLTF